MSVLGSMDVPSGGRRRASAAGHTMLEMVVVIALMLVALAASVPRGRAYLHEHRLKGAAYFVRSLMRQVRARAAAEGRYVGVVFDEAEGDPIFSIYADGNGNGIRRTDIDAGVDVRVREPYRLSTAFPGVRYGHLPTGASEPYFPGLRIGRSRIVSFSPIGSCTPGTLFLSNGDFVYAVVLLGATGRVRVARYSGGKWQAQ